MLFFKFFILLADDIIEVADLSLQNFSLFHDLGIIFVCFFQQRWKSFFLLREILILLFEIVIFECYFINFAIILWWGLIKAIF